MYTKPTPILLLLAVALAASACADETTTTTDPVDRGPSVFAIEADPNGLLWDDATNTLFIADSENNRILAWTDEAGVSLVSDLPPTTASSPGLGQLVRLSDGTLVVTRFGSGTAGDVVFVRPGQAAAIVPNLDPERRRIGLTRTADDRLFVTWFVRLSTGDRVGAVGELDLAGTETVVLDGLKKPVGVLAVDDALIITDQDLNQIIRAPIAAPSTFTVLAALEGPDLLTLGPAGDLYLGSLGGAVYRVAASGTSSVVTTGYDTVRGVAVDLEARRLFVAEHEGHGLIGADHSLHIVPLD